MTYTSWQRVDHIREIQEYLRTLALIDNNYSDLAVDGIYGEETETAVRQFQLTSGLPVTGTVDTITWEHLTHDYRNALTLLSDAVALNVFPAPQHRLRLGDSGDLIYILQAVVNTLADLENERRIPTSGIFDAETQARIRDLQKTSGFPQNGEVDRDFWDHLATWYNHA